MKLKKCYEIKVKWDEDGRNVLTYEFNTHKEREAFIYGMLETEFTYRFFRLRTSVKNGKKKTILDGCKDYNSPKEWKD